MKIIVQVETIDVCLLECTCIFLILFSAHAHSFNETFAAKY